MDNKNIIKLESSLLDKLITAYNLNKADGEISVNFDNRELRALILSTKNELAREEILDHELFQRRELKIEFHKQSEE